MRQVRGVLFVDYVRMLRSQKAVDWNLHLAAEDLPYLQMHIEPGQWYPMATFERMGNAILTKVTRGELFPVQLWGRYSAAQLRAANPTLLAQAFAGARSAPDLASALAAARALGGPILVAGSLFLVGEARHLLLGAPTDPIALSDPSRPA